MAISFPITFGPLSGAIPLTDLDSNFTAINSAIGTSPGNLVALDGSAKLPAVDGSQLTNLPSASQVVQVRQTVLSGPVDSNGLPNFGGSTGSGTVTAAGTLIATAANGFGASGNVDRIGSIVNPSWTGLTTNGVMYLGLTIASNGGCTPFVTTLQPVYQWGGTFSTTANQRTFNIQAMQMQVGNGSTASQSYDIFIGEVLVSANVTSSITWYAIMGRYEAPYTSTLPSGGTATSFNHNLGVVPSYFRTKIKCLTGEFNYSVGDEADPLMDGTGAPVQPFLMYTTYKTGGFTTWNAVASAWGLFNKSTGAPVTITLANWAYKSIFYRGW